MFFFAVVEDLWMSTDFEAWICNIKKNEATNRVSIYLFVKLVEWARAGWKNSFRLAKVFFSFSFNLQVKAIKREADSIAFDG